MKKIPIHTFLMAIFPVLFLYSHNISEVFLSQIFIPIIVVLGTTILLFLLLFLILKNMQKAGIILTLFIFLFFSYGHVYNFLKESPFVIKNVLSPWLNKVLFSVWLILILIEIVFFIKMQKDELLNSLGKIFNFFTLTLIAISFFNIISINFQSLFSVQDTVRTENNYKINIENTDNKNNYKDIYYIILDRYAGERSLRNYYDFNNTEFIEYLEKKGFYVAPDSRANYLRTFLSLASSLNMKHLDYITSVIGKNSIDKRPIQKMLQNHEIGRILKSKGYIYYHIGSWWYPTSYNFYADFNYGPPVPEFSILILNTTMLYPFLSRSNIYERKDRADRVLFQFKKIEELGEKKGPKFVFAHILCPHPPYVFDKDGSFLSKETTDSRSEKENYINQLVFLNTRIIHLIDQLLSNSDNPPIVLLQSDEGPYPARYTVNKEDFYWKEASVDEVKEKMEIFNAYFFPGVDTSVLYPSISPVNSFRMVFNLYFNTDLDLLPDRSYAYTDEKHPYQFLDVTDILNENNN